MAPARNYSPAPSQIGGMMYPPPGYQSGRNTPQMFMPQPQMDMLYQPAPSRPATNYLDIAIPSSRSPEQGDISGSPSDAELERALQDILRTADLNLVTKKDLRRQLEERFGVDLTSRKVSINAMVDRLLNF